MARNSFEVSSPVDDHYAGLLQEALQITDENERTQAILDLRARHTEERNVLLVGRESVAEIGDADELQIMGNGAVVTVRELAAMRDAGQDLSSEAYRNGRRG